MNIRKPIDYSAMFTALDALMAAELPQMELYGKIGQLVSERPEKGAAVAAAEYLQGRYPEASGFSPRNVRRMRDFYRLYENTIELMEQALRLNWTQNVVIMEADLSTEERSWYLQACTEHGIRCDGHRARQLTNCDYDEYDLLIGMDQANLRNMYRIISAPIASLRSVALRNGACGCSCGGDYAGKMHLLLAFTDRRKGPPAKPKALLGRGEARERSEFSPQAETEGSGLCFDEVADPWYTDDFDATWRDVSEGCQELVDYIEKTEAQRHGTK